MRSSMSRLFGALATSLVCALPLAAQDIGIVASLTPQMSGQPPGQGLRILGQGSGVVADER